MKINLNLLILLSISLFGLNLQSQNALDFDGTDDKIDCGNDTSVQISGKQLTLEAWIYPTAWKTNVYEGNIINKENNSNNYGFMLRAGAGGKLNFGMGNGSWTELTSAGTILTLNKWQHVAATYDGIKIRLYLNGVITDSVGSTISITNTTVTNLAIGYNATYGRYFPGMIDEVRIWNICRTQADLYNNMSKEFCNSSKGLRAYYKFNQGKAGSSNSSITTLIDLSGFNNSGTLSGFSLSGGNSNWLKSQNFARTIAVKHDTTISCDQYYSPSGKYKWTQSGVYNDTLPVSPFGCDSVLIIHLTIKKSSTSKINAFACKSYKSPSGLYTWTKSGTYKDYLKNYVKCDSIIIITLKIGGSKDSINPKICKSYKSPAGKTYTSSGLYSDTLKDYRGCDSIIKINLTIYDATFSTYTQKACRSYTSPSGKYIYTTTGTYTDTIKNFHGCDSILTIQLQIKSSSSSIKKSACNQYISPSGKYKWTSTGTYKDTLLNSVGCDSLMTIQLTINKPTSGNTAISACHFYKSTGKKRIWKISGTYKDTLVNYLGCDSFLTIQLTIINLNTGVTQSNSILTAVNQTGAYEWLTCSPTMPVIPGETKRSFKPTSSGNYAVEVTDSGCTDTSICYTVNVVSIPQIQKTAAFKILPNPNNGTFEIILPFECTNAILSVRESSGKLIFEQTFEKLKQSRIQLNQINSSGIYFIEIDSKEFKSNQNLVIEY